jgi:hypothetical protein
MMHPLDFGSDYFVLGVQVGACCKKSLHVLNPPAMGGVKKLRSSFLRTQRKPSSIKFRKRKRMPCRGRLQTQQLPSPLGLARCSLPLLNVLTHTRVVDTKKEIQRFVKEE